MMNTPDNFRRHQDGSIDFDFYRASAATLRRNACKRTFVTLFGALMRLVSGAKRERAGALQHLVR